MVITKKAISVILATVLTFSMLTVYIFAADIVQDETTIIYGDVSKDGKVSLVDGFILLASKLGILSLDETQENCADVNADGIVGFSDIWLIVRFSFGSIDSFPADDIPLPDDPDDPDEPDEPEEKHLLEKYYKYDKETGYEYFIDMNYTLDSLSMRMRIHVKGNKTLAVITYGGMGYSVLMDGEKYYIIMPASMEYCEVPEDEIDEIGGYESGNMIDFANLTFVNSIKVTLDGTGCVCEKYSSTDTEYSFWFNTSGVVRMELTTDGKTSVYTVNEFSPSVNDNVFTIPSGYEKVNWNDIMINYT